MQGALRFRVFLLFFLLVVLLLGGCGSSPFDRGRSALKNAQQMGWQSLQLRGGNFTLLGVASPPGNRPRLHVYIEGDGLAWIDRTHPSPDPTPDDPVSLRLALQDNSAAVLYLARPCQFIGPSMTNRCHMRHWTSYRFSSEVIASYVEIIASYARRIGAREVVVIGFSGGGVVAALTAARLPETVGLITVASPLDTQAWTHLHRVSPLKGSLNPKDIRRALQDFPQVHFVGQKDPIVPISVVRSYSSGMAQSRIISVAGQKHSCCWPDVWPDLLVKAQRRLSAQ